MFSVDIKLPTVTTISEFLISVQTIRSTYYYLSDTKYIYIYDIPKEINVLGHVRAMSDLQVYTRYTLYVFDTVCTHNILCT